MQGTGRLGITPGARYRTVPEAQIVELLALHGWAQRMRDGDGAAAVEEARDALGRWVAAGLPFERAPGGDRRFDPAEVMNTIKWAAIHRGDPMWRERFVATGCKLIGEFHGVEDVTRVPPPPTALGARRFSVTLEREFNMQAPQAGKPIRLRLPLPLEGTALRELAVASMRCSVDAALAVGPGRLDARLSVPAGGMVTLGATLSFVAYPTVPMSDQGDLPPGEIELYTRPSEGIIQVDARVRALAADIAGSIPEPWQAVERFWSFIADGLTSGVLHDDELGSSNSLGWVLESGWYDCRFGSALLVALCRARGLPARMASGYALYSASPFHHYWMEVWIAGRGWAPLDLFCADFAAMRRDRAWRDYFLGSLDYRMQTQRLPRLFDRSPAVRFPPSWYTLERRIEDGAEVGFFETASGALIYRDRISIDRTK